MSSRAVFSSRFIVVALACAVGFSSAMALPVPSSSECKNACSSIPIDDNGCPENQAVEELCTRQGPECEPNGCAMGLCYDDEDMYWWINCTDVPN